MPVTILSRASWAPYVDPARYAHAAAAPVPSDEPWDPAPGGVFIHHRGPASPLGFEYDTEADCQKDIAYVYDEHTSDAAYGGDIAYNFLICKHGNIYQGRGYERGEANFGDVIGGTSLGRNSSFYSICGLMRSNQTATEAMLRSFRALIEHLRGLAAPLKKAGVLILPHSYQYDTECPGNLTMYAQPGSTIDPAAPWSGLADIYVYAAQKWVNATYGSVAKYVRCPENGRTGWSTVEAFTQGLQLELGVPATGISTTFGPTTWGLVKARNTVPARETNKNLVRLYNGALWCKGYWTSTDLAVWSADSQTALQTLYTDAGLTYAATGVVWPYVCRALMRMDQFRLVSGGDGTVRQIQQRLNQRYVTAGIDAFNLVPCDGFYSRDVQQGLMMGMQKEVGIAVGSINGNFGELTKAGLRGIGSQSLTGNLRYLFRAACYFNSPVPVVGGTPLAYTATDLDTDAQTGTHTGWLQTFQRFTQIPQTATNDFTTWAQLLVSTGDQDRPATGCDGATEITAARAQALVAAGYRIVGRYLDEHLAPGDDGYLGKALKAGEPQIIIGAGLRLLPIFQYNGRELASFTYDKGFAQAQIAHQKCVEHRIPAGTCVYFAVDYDAMDVDIDGGIKQYFQGVAAGLAALGTRYTFGVYGPRNVCTRISKEAGAKWSLVSGLSNSFSGNLGFPLPENWSFNQIKEIAAFQTGWALDHDVWRDGSDPGVSSLVNG